MIQVTVPYEEFHAADMHLRISAEDHEAISNSPSKLLPGRRELISRILMARRRLGMSMNPNDVIDTNIKP